MQYSFLLYSAGTTPAMEFALRDLSKSGFRITDHPAPEITHLLLDVPSFRPDGALRNGGNISALLDALPSEITVIGGRLNHTDLLHHSKIDLLEDPFYLAKNAAITAHCALQVAAAKMAATFDGTDVLILGWGRIGKCLSQLLKNIGANVTVAARKAEDRAMLQALGFDVADTESLTNAKKHYCILFNTIPAQLLKEQDFDGCLKIDLASGNCLPGADVIHANGLPGQLAPESSGNLIAQTVSQILKGV